MESRSQVAEICRKLGITDEKFIEIELKRRLHFAKYDKLREFLKKNSFSSAQPVSFFDQYLDTKDLAMSQKGVSLRIRYKQDGAKVYIQYKGPGFLRNNILFRSEFNSGKLPNIVLKEHHNNFVHFNEKNVQDIILNHLPDEMAAALRDHLGAKILGKISVGNLICFYKKEKFLVKKGKIYLEPSLDKIYSFYVRGERIYPMATFSEYENEIKAENNSLEGKLDNLPFLLKFDRMIASKFGLPPERQDKYHRCLSLFAKSLPKNSFSQIFTRFSGRRKK